MFLLFFADKHQIAKAGCHNSFEEKEALFGGLVPSPAELVNSSFLNTLSSCFTTKTLPHNEGERAERDQSAILSDFCFPSVLVAGFPKCATSFLFHALSMHPHILPTRRKELCLGGPLSETWPKLASFLPTMEDTSAAGGHLVLTGCLHLGANIRATKELCVPTANMKVIFLVRDVADMLWAAYNYWCNVETDGSTCFPGEGANMERSVLGTHLPARHDDTTRASCALSNMIPRQ